MSRMKKARAIIVLLLSVILSSTCAHIKKTGARDSAAPVSGSTIYGGGLLVGIEGNMPVLTLKERHYEKRPIPSKPSTTLQLS
jgi:hypothetical protein